MNLFSPIQCRKLSNIGKPQANILHSLICVGYKKMCVGYILHSLICKLQKTDQIVSWIGEARTRLRSTKGSVGKK